MPAWLGPVIQGIAAVGGGILGNRANRQTARESMAFSERMASTQAQRSAKDYAAAGLNPALAYDRPAAAPGGTSAPQEDVISKGISSGMAARAQRAQLEQMGLMNEATAAQTAKTKIEGANALLQGELLGQERLIKAQELSLRTALQPHQTRSAAIANIAAQYGLSKSKAEAAYYDMMGPAAIGIDQLAGPAAGVGGALIGGAALLRKGGQVMSSGRAVRGMFKPPAARRVGDWERLNKNRGDMPPRGIMR